MIERAVDITTSDGVMGTFVTHPDSGVRPVIILLMDAPGKREELHVMARRLSSAGYYVMLANLYYRQVDHYNVFETGDRARMFELMTSLSNAMVVRDVAAMLAFADDDPAADATRVGVVGYCMSGPFSLMVAAGHNTVVKAAASIYGVRLAVDAKDSPHRHLASIHGEIYVACAESDEYAPPEMVAQFEQAAADAAETAGLRATVEWYPGTHHGFAFPQRDQYDHDGAERHWSRLHDLFRRNLL
jgi:carboxymethylenebutenolidase